MSAGSIIYNTTTLSVPKITRFTPRLCQERNDNYSTSRKHEALAFDHWYEIDVSIRRLTLDQYYALYSWLSWALLGETFAFALNADKTAYGVLDGAAAAGQKVIPIGYYLDNYNFETLDGADDFADWTEYESGGGLVEDETVLVYGGSHACKITNGGGVAHIKQSFTVIPGERLKLWFYTRGDGTNAGVYSITDGTNDIVGITSTGVTGTTYTLVTQSFTVPAGVTTVWIFLHSPPTGVAYFDDCWVFPDFAVDDYCLLKQASGDNYEIIKIDSFVSGVSFTAENNLESSYASGDILRAAQFFPTMSLKQKEFPLPMEAKPFYDVDFTLIEEK